MDVQPWHQPEVIYTVFRRIHSLPHACAAVIVCCAGALETWEQFMSEFALGEMITSLMPSEVLWNDANEGALVAYPVFHV